MTTKKTPELVDKDELFERARAIVTEHGGATAVARIMGYKQPTISNAVNHKDDRFDGTREAILRVLGGYDVVKVPFWKLTRRPRGTKKTAPKPPPSPTKKKRGAR